MSPLAVLEPPEQSRELIVLLDVAFMAFVLVSFVRVLSYTVRQVRAGRMIDNLHAPLRLVVPGAAGWLFAFSVLVLLFAQSPLYILIVVAGLAAFLSGSGRGVSQQFGLNRLPARKVIKWSLFICGAVIFIELPLSQLIDLSMNAIHLPHPEQESVEIFRHYNQAGEIFAFLVQAVLISPFIEELFFRGFLLTFLKNYTSTGSAIVLSAGVFAFAHANIGAVLQLWVLGMVLGVAYQHTGSLLLSFGIHACWNLLTAISLLLDRASF